MNQCNVVMYFKINNNSNWNTQDNIQGLGDGGGDFLEINIVGKQNINKPVIIDRYDATGSMHFGLLRPLDGPWPVRYRAI